ncbi:hypothetical protein KBC59_02755 [Patescibacteria group bacterium]|nr:hypothetical protein [Patescibacteria group bacterium]
MSADVENAQKPSDVSGESQKVSAIETKLLLAQKIITRLKEEIANLEHILSSKSEPADLEEFMRAHGASDGGEAYGPTGDGKILEGVFDGQNMVGSDGRQYIIPQNYASKSKLVEGDILKLTIQPNGTFLYKQIGPIERQRVVGTLVKDDLTNDWKVLALGRKYSVLTAAISFLRGGAGDEAVILIPKSAPSKWAAIENVIKRA